MEIFQVEQTVVWKNKDNPIVRDYGPGPFTITRIENVPIECWCGESLIGKGEREHVELCPYAGTEFEGTILGSVGYIQWMWITNQKTGKKVSERFSDVWFTSA